MPTFVSAPRAAPHRPPGRAPSQPGRGHHDPYRGPPTQVLSVSGKAAVSEVDGVALEYALVARRYMRGDAAAYLAEIDQPGTRMARSPCARPGRDRRPPDAAPRGLGGVTRLRPAAPSRCRHGVPDTCSARPGRPGRRLTILIATVRDYLPAGLSSVLASGTGERYSPEVAALLLGAWAVGALAAGLIALHRRDP
jgi:hypothetical protein